MKRHDTLAPSVTAPEAPADPGPELFNRHVGAVLERGDAADARIDLWAKQGAIVGTIASLGAVVSHHEHPVKSLLWAGGAVVGMWIGTHLKGRNAALKKAEELLGIDAQFENDARYELYRVRQRNAKDAVVMRWYGTMANRRGLSSELELTRVAELAKEAGVKRQERAGAGQRRWNVRIAADAGDGGQEG